MDSIKRLAAVEGLRGWLAWAVLFDHVAYFSNFRAPFLGQFLRDIGPPAVLVFIIVSGFVITHLLIERPEPYSAYLLRRFMRIFPLFAVTCIGGYGLVGNRPFAVWSIIYLGFLLHPSVNGIFVQAYRLALESRLATYFGRARIQFIYPIFSLSSLASGSG
jgi:peptidoglycan/LPS O-acetylase OafA/YrhL